MPKRVKSSLTRIARRKMYAPKHARQTFTISKSNTKIRHGVSKAETQWLDRLNVPERSKLMRGFNGKIMILCIESLLNITETIFTGVTRVIQQKEMKLYHGLIKLQINCMAQRLNVIISYIQWALKYFLYGKVNIKQAKL